MTKTKYSCLSCGGTYSDTVKIAEDVEMQYFHCCPDGVDNPRNENVDSKGKIKLEGKGRVKI